MKAKDVFLDLESLTKEQIEIVQEIVPNPIFVDFEKGKRFLCYMIIGGHVPYGIWEVTKYTYFKREITFGEFKNY